MFRRRILVFLALAVSILLCLALVAFAEEASGETGESGKPEVSPYEMPVSFKIEVTDENGNPKIESRTATVSAFFNTKELSAGSIYAVGIKSQIIIKNGENEEKLSAKNVTEFTVPKGIVGLEFASTTNATKVETIVVGDGVSVTFASVKALSGLKNIIVSGKESTVAFGTECAGASLEKVAVTTSFATVTFNEGAFKGCTSLKTVELGRGTIIEPPKEEEPKDEGSKEEAPKEEVKVEPEYSLKITFGKNCFEGTGIRSLALGSITEYVLKAGCFGGIELSSFDFGTSNKVSVEVNIFPDKSMARPEESAPEGTTPEGTETEGTETEGTEPEEQKYVGLEALVFGTLNEITVVANGFSETYFAKELSIINFGEKNKVSLGSYCLPNKGITGIIVGYETECILSDKCFFNSEINSFDISSKTKITFGSSCFPSKGIEVIGFGIAGEYVLKENSLSNTGLKSVTFAKGGKYLFEKNCLPASTETLVFNEESTYTLEQGCFANLSITSATFATGVYTFRKGCLPDTVEMLTFGVNGEYVLEEECFRNIKLTSFKLNTEKAGETYTFTFGKSCLPDSVIVLDFGEGGVYVLEDECFRNTGIESVATFGMDNKFTFGKYCFPDKSGMTSFSFGIRNEFVIGENAFSNISGLVKLEVGGANIFKFGKTCLPPSVLAIDFSVNETSNTYLLKKECFANLSIGTINLGKQNEFTLEDSCFSASLESVDFGTENKITLKDGALSKATLTSVNFGIANILELGENSMPTSVSSVNFGTRNTVVLDKLSLEKTSVNSFAFGENNKITFKEHCLPVGLFEELCFTRGNTYVLEEKCFQNLSLKGVTFDAPWNDSYSTFEFHKHCFPDNAFSDGIKFTSANKYSFFEACFQNTGIKKLEFVTDTTFTFNKRCFADTAIEEITFAKGSKYLFGDECFAGVPITTLDFVDGSSYDFTGMGAFNGCASLEYIHTGMSLTVLNNQPFKNCTGLKMVYMENVTAIQENAFCIEKDFVEANDSALKVYVHTKANVTVNGAAFVGRNTAGVLFCAMNPSATSFSSCKYEIQFGNNHAYTPVYDRPTCYNSYKTDCPCGVVTNVYYKSYKTGQAAEVRVSLVEGANPGVDHIFSDAYSMEYANGISSEGTVVLMCGICKTKAQEATKAPAIVEFLGYSVREDGQAAILAGTRVNYFSLRQYEAVMGITLEYGMVVANEDELGSEVFTSEGVAKEGVFDLNLSQRGLYNCTLKLNLTTEDAKETDFIFCAYVKIGRKTVYLDGVGEVSLPSPVCYYDLVEE